MIRPETLKSCGSVRGPGFLATWAFYKLSGSHTVSCYTFGVRHRVGDTRQIAWHAPSYSPNMVSASAHNLGELPPSPFIFLVVTGVRMLLAFQHYANIYLFWGLTALFFLKGGRLRVSCVEAGFGHMRFS